MYVRVDKYVFGELALTLMCIKVRNDARIFWIVQQELIYENHLLVFTEIRQWRWKYVCQNTQSYTNDRRRMKQGANAINYKENQRDREIEREGEFFLNGKVRRSMFSTSVLSAYTSFPFSTDKLVAFMGH